MTTKLGEAMTGVRLDLTMTQRQWEALVKAAKRKGVSVAVYVRDAALRQAGAPR